jgi:hypothetical protein
VPTFLTRTLDWYRQWYTQRQLARVKKTFRIHYLKLQQCIEGYSCGLNMVFHLSSNASVHANKVIEAGTWLIQNDPECPDKMETYLELVRRSLKGS